MIPGISSIQILAGIEVWNNLTNEYYIHISLDNEHVYTSMKIVMYNIYEMLSVKWVGI